MRSTIFLMHFCAKPHMVFLTPLFHKNATQNITTMFLSFYTLLCVSPFTAPSFYNAPQKDSTHELFSFGSHYSLSLLRFFHMHCCAIILYFSLHLWFLMVNTCVKTLQPTSICVMPFSPCTMVHFTTYHIFDLRCPLFILHTTIPKKNSPEQPLLHIKKNLTWPITILNGLHLNLHKCIYKYINGTYAHNHLKRASPKLTTNH